MIENKEWTRDLPGGIRYEFQPIPKIPFGINIGMQYMVIDN